MVSIRQISCATRQKLGNLRSQTGNFVAQQSCATKLLNFVACLTSALGFCCEDMSHSLMSCETVNSFAVCKNCLRHLVTSVSERMGNLPTSPTPRGITVTARRSDNGGYCFFSYFSFFEFVVVGHV